MFGRLPATGLYGRKILRPYTDWAGPGCLPSLGYAGVLALSGGIPGAGTTTRLGG
jgi:hypothetical protein